jgi:hypothetical protein
VNLRCTPGAKADEPRRSGLLLECGHACLNIFLDCLVAALEVRRTTEDDGIIACRGPLTSPGAY